LQGLSQGSLTQHSDAAFIVMKRLITLTATQQAICLTSEWHGIAAVSQFGRNRLFGKDRLGKDQLSGKDQPHRVLPLDRGIDRSDLSAVTPLEQSIGQLNQRSGRDSATVPRPD